MFIAVGDEWRQRVDMVGMLDHWDFIGLLMQGKKREKQTKRIYKQEATSEQQVSIT